ncbi:MAG: sigma-E processing peptidase SpoIIGA [Prevotella sp.]|nr:sigma-E processing peptidase SpoIIGA [Staphylococcus sp.]MCM1351077.1 sigma-E processing peptidase SpoIIGA [Prevotella sp.]
MIVYLDLLILSTVVVNWAFIKTIAFFFKEKLSLIRLLLALALSVGLLFLYLLPYRTYFALRYIAGIFIGIVAFHPGNVKVKIIEIVLFYFLTMAFIGTLFVFQVKSVILMLVSLVYVIVLYIIQNYQKFFQKEQHLQMDIQIGTHHMKGYYDTGNTSYYYEMPIVYVNQTYQDCQFKKIDCLAIQTIDGNSQIDIYRGPLLQTKNQSYVVAYAFVKQMEYQVILHRDIS